jgi:chromosome segregation ATPase
MSKNQKVAAQISDLNQEIKHAHYLTELAKLRNEALSNLLSDEGRRMDKAEKDASDAKGHDAGCQADYERLQKESDVHISDMRRRLTNLQYESSTLEDTMRKEFGRKLELKLSQCQKEAVARKNAGLAEMKFKYDEKWVEYNNQINEATDRNDALRQKVVDATLELNALNNRHKGDSNLAQAEERRTDELMEEFENIRFSISKANVEDLKKITELEELLKQKDKEYASLLKIKDDLAMEIRAYRLLLENEEHRLGGISGAQYTSPVKGSTQDSEPPPTVKMTNKVAKKVMGRTPAPLRRSKRARANE